MPIWDLEKVLEGSNKMMIDPDTSLDTVEQVGTDRNEGRVTYHLHGEIR